MSEFLQRLKSSFHNGIEFITDTRKELKNVSWPGRREVTGTTLVVIAAVFFFGFFLSWLTLSCSHGLTTFGRISRHPLVRKTEDGQRQEVVHHPHLLRLRAQGCGEPDEPHTGL